MRLLLTALASLVSLSTVSAQATRSALFPTPGVGQFTVDTSLPFGGTAGSVVRYQIWISRQELADYLINTPITAIEFPFGATFGSNLPPMVDFEVRMANLTTTPSAVFDNNIPGASTVLPRQWRTLPPHGGATPLRLNLAQGFAWSGNHLVIDFRVYQTTLPGGQLYYTQAVTNANYGSGMFGHKGATVYGSLLNTIGTVQMGTVNSTRLFFLGGNSVYGGAGCPGQTGVPFIVQSGLPRQSNPSWGITCANARPGAAAVLVLGGSRVWSAGQGSSLLPSPLAPVGGAGCMLWTSPDLQLPVTIGANGTVTVPVSVPNPMPPGGIGSQFIIVDPAAPNGTMATTDYMWTVFG